MRISNVITAALILSASLFGCGKKSALEGKVIDGKGQPMAGVRVVARELQPIKGHSASTTGVDGIFRFKNLSPDSEYELIPYLQTGLKSRSAFTRSAPEGRNMMLPNPLPILFVPTKDGLLIRSTSSGLLWVIDAGKSGKMNWDAAMSLAKHSTYAGYSDWRLPTKDELRSTAAYGGIKPYEKLNADVFTNIQAGCYWTGTVEGNDRYAWAVNMSDGKKVNDLKTGNYHVWLVRQGS